MFLGVGVVIGLAFDRAADERAMSLADADCEVAELEARAPDFDATPLADEALLALAGEAAADILEHCNGLSDWWKAMLYADAMSWSPGFHDGRSLAFPEMPDDVVALRKRVCGRGYASAREVPYLRGRERGHMTFASCKFERLGLLSREDTAYVDPGVIHYWTIHQVLLDSGLSDDAARRYFLALTVATDISERAGAELRLRDGVLTSDGSPGKIRFGAHGDIDSATLQALFEARGDGCRLYGLSVAPDEPMRNVQALITSSCAEASDSLDLAIDEREHLLRPLRAEIDLAGDTSRSEAGLEIDVAASGIWTAKGESGHSAALEALLDRQRPQWVVLRVDPDTPARLAVDLARVVDVWRSRKPHSDTILLMKGKPSDG